MPLKPFLTSIFHLWEENKSFSLWLTFLSCALRRCFRAELKLGCMRAFYWCILWERSDQISLYCRTCLSKQDTAQTPLFPLHILRDGMCWLKLKRFQWKERNTFLLYVFTAFLHLSACSHLRDKNLAEHEKCELLNNAEVQAIAHLQHAFNTALVRKMKTCKFERDKGGEGWTFIVF